MDSLTTRIDRGIEDLESRSATNLALVEALRARLDGAKQGGGGKYVQRHRERGKSLPRERIAEICDAATPFLELSTLAANDLSAGRAHSAGTVTGIGVGHGQACVFVANGATVKRGTYYPITAKKHGRAQEIA